MKKLVMVTGVQRSGTSALFLSLARDPKVKSFGESLNNEVFKNWNLRPEKEIRDVLRNNSASTILLKPVNETNVRSVNDILNEFNEYDVKICWLYRDPVNVFYSVIKHYTNLRENTTVDFYELIRSLPTPESAVEPFIQNWNQRNRYILTVADKYKSKIAIVKYCDLISDPKVFLIYVCFLA